MSLPADATLLLVEDDPDDVFLMQQALQDAEITNALQLAEHGRQATEYLVGQGDYADRVRFPLPHLVFLDLKIPYKNGFEILEFMRERQMLEAIAVVVLTSSSQPRDFQRAYQLGARSYLVKPPSPQMLRELIGSLAPFWSKSKSRPPLL